VRKKQGFIEFWKNNNMVSIHKSKRDSKEKPLPKEIPKKASTYLEERSSKLLVCSINE
jgi:5-methylcytosine-specific restriction endonuclease McrA